MLSLDGLSILGRGWLIGFAITAGSYGPLSLLFARRTLTQGRRIGFASGLGVAAGDGVSSSIAALGLSFVSAFLVEQHIWLSFIGGLIMCFIGLDLARRIPADLQPAATGTSLAGAFLSTLGLAVASPSEIPVYVGIFATFGLPIGTGQVGAALYLGVGIFVGSACFRLIETVALGAVRGRLAPNRLRVVSLIAGVVVLGFAAIAIGSGVVDLAHELHRA